MGEALVVESRRALRAQQNEGLLAFACASERNAPASAARSLVAPRNMVAAGVWGANWERQSRARWRMGWDQRVGWTEGASRETTERQWLETKMSSLEALTPAMTPAGHASGPSRGGTVT